MQIQHLLFLICGVLSVNGLRLTSNTLKAEEPVKPIENVEPLSLESSDNTSDSVETAEEAVVSKDRPVVAASAIIHTTTILHNIPLGSEVSRRLGPVELGLRNVVAASAAATEDLYLHMTALNAETSHMINSKSEILTSHAMNDLYEPLHNVEDAIKKTEECGKRYETALNMIFKDIDSSLKECNKNLTTVGVSYTNENVGTLTALSIAAEEMNNLPVSCDIAENFAVGTFCVVNNLAEMNERVVSDIKVIKENTKLAVEETEKAVVTTEICQKKLVEKVTEKLSALQKEINTKCVERKP